MKLSEVEHVLRAASEVTKEKEFICIGSQALLGQFPDAPRELRVSIDTGLRMLLHHRFQLVETRLKQARSIRQSPGSPRISM
jgi:hypothetical protein